MMIALTRFVFCCSVSWSRDGSQALAGDFQKEKLMNLNQNINVQLERYDVQSSPIAARFLLTKQIQVLEETGYNIANQINPENVIRMSIKEQKISLYIVHGVPEDFPFETRTRKEISVRSIQKLPPKKFTDTVISMLCRKLHGLNSKSYRRGRKTRQSQANSISYHLLLGKLRLLLTVIICVYSLL